MASMKAENTPVQINFTVTWKYREQLRKQAKKSHTSFASLCRDALMKEYPEKRAYTPPEVEHEDERDATDDHELSQSDIS